MAARSAATPESGPAARAAADMVAPMKPRSLPPAVMVTSSASAGRPSIWGGMLTPFQAVWGVSRIVPVVAPETVRSVRRAPSRCASRCA